MTVDPGGLWIEEYPDGGFSITCEVWSHGNKRHRIARMNAVARRIKRDGWKCSACGEKVPLYRRADATYCRESCRKRMARERRGRRLACW